MKINNYFLILFFIMFLKNINSMDSLKKILIPIVNFSKEKFTSAVEFFSRFTNYPRSVLVGVIAVGASAVVFVGNKIYNRYKDEQLKKIFDNITSNLKIINNINGSKKDNKFKVFFYKHNGEAYVRKINKNEFNEYKYLKEGVKISPIMSLLLISKLNNKEIIALDSFQNIYKLLKKLFKKKDNAKSLLKINEFIENSNNELLEEYNKLSEE